MWDGGSFVVGLIIGMAIAFFLIWLLYITKVFIFSSCAIQYPICTAADYYQDPGQAIANGSKVEDILFIVPDTQSIETMTYERQPRVNTCTPSSTNQIVVVNPQWCDFDTTNGTKYDAMNLGFDSTVYSYKNNTGNTITVVTNGNGQCIPKSSTGNVVVGGVPLLRWTPYPISL